MAEKGGIWRTAQLSLFLYSTDSSEGVLFRNRLNLYTYQPVKKLLTVPLSQWAATQMLKYLQQLKCSVFAALERDHNYPDPSAHLVFYHRIILVFLV